MFGSGVSVWYLPDWLYLWKGPRDRHPQIRKRKFRQYQCAACNGKESRPYCIFGRFLKNSDPLYAVRFVFKDQPDYAYVYMLYIGLGVILGHNYPFYLHFKGGKGIAATAGIIFSIDWRLTVLCLAVFVLIVAVTRYVSLGSLVVSVILLAWNIYMGRCGAYSLSAISSIEYSAVTAVIAAMAFWRHRANIVRLIHGNENKIGAKKS